MSAPEPIRPPEPQARRLRGRAVIVTGAAQGIGEATARRLAAEGASVVLVDRAEAVGEVAARGGGVAVVGDVTEEATIAAAMAAVEDLGVGLWGLAHVAGVHHAGDALTTSDADWDRLLAINLTASWRWSRAVLPTLLEAGRGAIVLAASINASFARPEQLAYTVSKHGVLGLVHSLAVDFGRRGVRTNAISPGSTETPMLREFMERVPRARTEQLERTFSPRLGVPEDMAAACAYLLSDEASYVNGLNLCVDGGRTVAI